MSSIKSKAVGYCKPPQQYRFEKGRSGNPRGRPKKKAEELPTLVLKALGEPIIVNEGGRRKTVPKVEAIAKQVVNKAATGDDTAMKLLMTLLKQMPASKEPPIVIYQMVGDENL